MSITHLDKVNIRNDTKRLNKLTSVAITTTQILEMATQPWVLVRRRCMSDAIGWQTQSKTSQNDTIQTGPSKKKNTHEKRERLQKETKIGGGEEG